MNSDLQHYVREALARGVPREAIRATLTTARWRPEEIDAALAAWADGEAGLPVPRRRISLSAREAFLHLVLFATLYIYAFDVGALLFVIVDMHVRDAASPAGGLAGALEVLRWATAGVVTALPIFLLVHRVVERSIALDPEKRTSGVRRWLTYLTLFVAALVLIGDFSGLVSRMLAGELTARFLLKVLVVFAIAGAVFGHYLARLRGEEAEGEGPARRASWIGRAGVTAAAVAAVAGLVIAGAPNAARGRHFDTQRIDGLLMIHNDVLAYRERWRTLPANLGVLEQAGFDLQQARDPENGERYRYRIVDSLTYTLSARFSTADTLREDGYPVAPAWRHGRGPWTFTRTVPAALPVVVAPVLPPSGRPAR